eukprot:2806179-Rhodomonas_salina.2
MARMMTKKAVSTTALSACISDPNARCSNVPISDHLERVAERQRRKQGFVSEEKGGFRRKQREFARGERGGWDLERERMRRQRKVRKPEKSGRCLVAQYARSVLDSV